MQVPYFFLSLTDRHLLAFLRSAQSTVALASLFAHPSPPPVLSLAPATHSQPSARYHIAYIRVRPVYFLLSLESNAVLSLSFQRVPLRVRLPPFLRRTASVDDYLRHAATALLPAVLLQSPAFLAALDLFGSPGALLVALYHSLQDLLRSPLQTARAGDGLFAVVKSFSSASLALLQTLLSGLLRGLGGISNSLSRNIRRLGDDDGLLSLSLPFRRLACLATLLRTRSHLLRHTLARADLCGRFVPAPAACARKPKRRLPTAAVPVEAHRYGRGTAAEDER